METSEHDWVKADYNKATKAQQAEWNRFIAALHVHEDGHTKINVDHVNKIINGSDTTHADNVVKNAIGSGSGKTKPEAKAAADKALDGKIDAVLALCDAEEADAQRNYDNNTTKHGETQGAVLDASK
jgi:hypothetical protein